ncbi:unnamed protein product [Lota lota]
MSGAAGTTAPSTPGTTDTEEIIELFSNDTPTLPEGRGAVLSGPAESTGVSDGLQPSAVFLLSSSPPGRPGGRRLGETRPGRVPDRTTHPSEPPHHGLTQATTDHSTTSAGVLRYPTDTAVYVDRDPAPSIPRVPESGSLGLCLSAETSDEQEHKAGGRALVSRHRRRVQIGVRYSSSAVTRCGRGSGSLDAHHRRRRGGSFRVGAKVSAGVLMTCSAVIGNERILRDGRRAHLHTLSSGQTCAPYAPPHQGHPTTGRLTNQRRTPTNSRGTSAALLPPTASKNEPAPSCTPSSSSSRQLLCVRVSWVSAAGALRFVPGGEE